MRLVMAMMDWDDDSLALLWKGHTEQKEKREKHIVMHEHRT